MSRFVKTLLKGGFKVLGYELIRLSQSPAHTHLGLARRPIGTIIDVGANRGQFAQQFSKIFPKAEIHSFEPLPKPYQALRQWAESQGDQISTYILRLVIARTQLKSIIISTMSQLFNVAKNKCWAFTLSRYGADARSVDRNKTAR